MSFRFGQIAHSPSLPTLITEGLALFGLGLAFTTEYWLDTAGSPPQSAVMGAFLVFFAICAGAVAAVMLLVDIFRSRIDVGTFIAFVPFLGFAIWGIWFSYTELSWERNVPVYWAILGVIVALWLYVIVKYVGQRRGR